jgi:hypothetical protein
MVAQHCLFNQTILTTFCGKDMSAKRTAMRKIRELLRLSYSAGLSIRKINASTKISVGCIQNILKLAVQLNITWPLPEDWDDQTLALKFYPQADAQTSFPHYKSSRLSSKGKLKSIFE